MNFKRLMVGLIFTQKCTTFITKWRKTHQGVTISTNQSPFSKSFSSVVENWLKIRNFSRKSKFQMPFLKVVWLTCMQNVVIEKSVIELGDVQQQIEQWSNILSSFPRLEALLPLMLTLPYLLQQALHGMISTYLELHTRQSMPLGNQIAFTIALMQCQ